MPSTPNAGSHESLESRVRAVLELIRPGIQDDGGDVELVSVEAGHVRIRFLGACVTCPSKTMTLQGGIERLLKERLPEIGSVASVN